MSWCADFGFRVMHPELMGWGHGADAADVNDASTGFVNVTQNDVQFLFVVKTQQLSVVD